MKEIYTNIKEFEWVYQISNIGNLKSLSRVVDGPNGKKILSSRILKHSLVRGYKAVNLWRNGKSINVKIHRLVGLYFVNNPYNKPCINHKNGIKIDNKAENLEWVTYSENLIHARKIRLRKDEKKILQFDLDYNFLNEFKSLSEASKSINKYNQRGNISSCANGERKSAFSYKWEYKL